MTHSDFDNEMMARAIALAKSVDFVRDKNPRVGAVVVSAAGEVIGEGWHAGSGSDHAEVMALHQADGLATGSTVYTTLEPCASTGVKGPCTHALISAGVTRVVYGQSDPNQAMAGGAAALATSGVEVTSGVLLEECVSLNPTWTFAQINNRPWVIWKTATSLDGFVASVDGTSKWITSEESREVVQEIRASVGAILTGTGTVLIDDPLMTARHLSDYQQPLRLVLGQRKIPSESRILAGPNPGAVTHGDLAQVLNSLFTEHGIHRVLIEAGPGLSRSAWNQGLVDEVFWFQAPIIIGQGHGVLGDIGVNSLDQARKFSNYEVTRVGLDLLVHFSTHQGG